MENQRQSPYYDPIAEMLGPVGTAVFDVMLQSSMPSLVLLDLARAWQSNMTAIHAYFVFPASHPIRLLLSILFVTGWLFAFMRWFRWIGWPRLWAIPFVLLVLCPGAWVVAKRFGPGIDWLFLILLQLPIMVLFVLRVRARVRQEDRLRAGGQC